MKKDDKAIFSIVCFVLAALWCLIVLLFVDHTDAGFYYWGGFVFGLITCLIPAFTMLVIKNEATKATTEITMIPGFLSVAFVVIGLYFNAGFVYYRNDSFIDQVSNSLFISVRFGASKAVLVIYNVLAILIYLVLVYYLTRYNARVTETSEVIGGSIAVIGQIKTKLGSILAICKDETVKKQVLNLKQKVDYSNNLSQSITEDEENLFYSQIGGIEQLIRDNADQQEILALISEADKTWDIRNAKLMADR